MSKPRDRLSSSLVLQVQAVVAELRARWSRQRIRLEVSPVLHPAAQRDLSARGLLPVRS